MQKAIDIENLEMFDGKILLTNYRREKLVGSVLYAPEVRADSEFSTLPDNLFEVVKVSKNSREISEGVFLPNNNIKQGDIVVVDKGFLNYVDFKGKRYFTCDSLADIAGILTETEE